MIASYFAQKGLGLGVGAAEHKALQSARRVMIRFFKFVANLGVKGVTIATWSIEKQVIY